MANKPKSAVFCTSMYCARIPFCCAPVDYSVVLAATGGKTFKRGSVECLRCGKVIHRFQERTMKKLGV